MSTLNIIEILVGVVIGLFLILLTIWYCYRKFSRSKKLVNIVSGPNFKVSNGNINNIYIANQNNSIQYGQPIYSSYEKPIYH